MNQEQLRSLDPKYGVNYKCGYVGFQFEDKSLVSEGIAYFTRWDRLSQIRVSHTFIVACEDECMEAVRYGVSFSKLQERFDDPHCHVFFRKPHPWNHALAGRVVFSGASKIGSKYDFLLIAAMAIRGSLIGEALYRMMGEKFTDKITGWFDNRNRFICSEFVAWCLKRQPEYDKKGCLSFPAHSINPQQLFENNALFDNWKQGVTK